MIPFSFIIFTNTFNSELAPVICINAKQLSFPPLQEQPIFSIRFYRDLDELLAMIPTSRHIQPAIKNKPPNGVIMPMPLRPTVWVPFNTVNRYNDPEKRIIPTMNSHPDHTSHLPGKGWNKIPTAINANV